MVAYIVTVVSYDRKMFMKFGTDDQFFKNNLIRVFEHARAIN
jgi:hypothetical protein